MSDPIHDAVRAGAEPSDMRQLAERVWRSVDERYLVLCLTGSNYQCFERGATGWLPADRPCRHVSKVLEHVTGRKPDRALPVEHRRWEPVSTHADLGIDGLSLHDTRADRQPPEPVIEDQTEPYDPKKEEEARQLLARADLHLQKLNPVVLEPARHGRTVREVRRLELHAAQRAAIKALLLMSGLEDLYN